MSINDFGTRLADLRKRAELTQAALAEKLDVSDRAVSKWENAGGYPDITLLPLLADIFGVTTDYLLRGTPVKRQRFCLGWGDNKFRDAVNTKYLEKGWRVKDMELAGDGEGGCSCALVLEKDDYFGE
ncbi:MAG: helix-turn-helix transcriptional regulator [Clostridia bacterium]|nr:helix-turn-helix transcriptional regulator [Clostridia bacterium]